MLLYIYLIEDPWVQDFPEVWVTDKADVGTVKDVCILREGMDTTPQWQFRYSAEAE